MMHYPARIRGACPPLPRGIYATGDNSEVACLLGSTVYIAVSVWVSGGRKGEEKRREKERQKGQKEGREEGKEGKRQKGCELRYVTLSYVTLRCFFCALQYERSSV